MQVKSIIIKENNTKIININSAFYEIVLLYVSFYEYVYISVNPFLRTQRIEVEWQRIYNERMQSNNFFSRLLVSTQDSGAYDEEITTNVTELLTGNLCEALPKKVITQALCPTIMNGILQEGIIKATSYTLNILKSAKDEFDASGKTLDDVKRVLGMKEFVDIELTIRQWQYTAFETLGKIFETWTTKYIEGIQALLNWLLFMYIIILYCIVVPILAHLVSKNTAQRFFQWKRILRKVPLDIIMMNKQMKGFVFKTNFDNDSHSRVKLSAE